MSSLALEITDLSFSYKEKILFDRWNVSLEMGKFHILCGKNGAGKSTLLSLILGRKKFQGKIWKARPFAFLPQSYDEMLALPFTVAENLRFASFSGLPSLWPQKMKGDYPLLRKVGIDLGQRVEDLSGGQRQIVALCMLLQNRPKFLLVDEPTSATDTDFSDLLFATLLQWSEAGHTVLAVTHDHARVQKYCNGQKVQLIGQPCRI